MQQVEEYQRMMFSLADCTMTQAREYISFLIDFCLAEDVPTRVPLLELADDVQRGMYSCLLHKKCCVCQRRAELHHVDQVGMGYNRQTKAQLGALVLPLCREHHQEYHNRGRTAFESLYHVEPVELDERLAKVYGLTKKAAS